MQGPSLTSPAFSFVQDVGKSAVDKCLRSFCFMLTVLRPNQQHKSYFSALPQWIPQNYLDVPTLPCYPLFQILPKSGGSHRDNHRFQRMTAQKERTAPQHTRSFCRRFTPTKFFACTAWRYFSFLESCTLTTAWADRTWYRLFVNAAAQTGAGTSFGANGDPLHEQHHLYLFLRLNNSETITQKRFWAQR